MSVVGILSSNLLDYLLPKSAQNNSKSFQKEFQQLGQDLQSGNLSQAQTDFTALQPTTQSVASTSQSSSNSLASAFNQLSADLQSGNLSGAKKRLRHCPAEFQLRLHFNLVPQPLRPIFCQWAHPRFATMYSVPHLDRIASTEMPTRRLCM